MNDQLDFSTLNLQDALDLAILIEKEAEARYRFFIDQLGEHYPGDATDFFATMAGYERRHGAELAERRHLLFGGAAARVTADMIEDAEAPALGEPRPFMSVRHAMEIAMKSEVKAYEFFDQALPGIQDPAVRMLFKELRDEEVEHQRMLKEQMAKYPDTLAPDVDPDDVDTPEL